MHLPSNRARLAPALLTLFSALCLAVTQAPSAGASPPSPANSPQVGSTSEASQAVQFGLDSSPNECARKVSAAQKASQRDQREHSALCFEPTKKPDQSAQGAPKPPPWCVPVNTGWTRNRHDACMIRFGKVVHTRTNSNGQTRIIGTASVSIVNWMYTYSDDVTFTQHMMVQVGSTVGDTAGLSIAGSGFQCQGINCQPAKTSFSRQLIDRKGAQANAYLTARWGAPPGAPARGTQIKLSTVMEWVALNRQGNSTEPEYERAPVVRCDHALPGPTRPGCIIPEVLPVMLYKLKGPYPELAKHIAAAQKSGLPGAYSAKGQKATVLFRLTDGKKITKNRDRSCPTGRGSYPRPPGKTCDEYPFASTYQGAWTANPSTSPSALRRTFSWCSLPSAVPKNRTGKKGYSICMINGKQNTDGGRALDNFYVDQRVLEKDAFQVWIK